MRQLPVRWRLTLWYTGLLALVMLVVGVIVFGSLRWRLRDAVDDDLARYANQAVAELSITNGSVNRATLVGIPESYGVQVFVRQGDAIESVPIHVDGGPLAPSQPFNEVSFNADAGKIGVTDALQGDKVYADVVSSSGSDLRSIVVPIRSEETGSVIGAIQVFQSRESLDQAVRELGRTLAIVSPIMLAFAAAAGYALAGRALRPVSRITSLASTIGAGDLHARLNLDLPNDELGRLAQTFDGMLGRMQHAFDRQAQFTGDAAHELRTPLTSMRALIDLTLSRDRSPEAYREAISQLDVDLERLTNLVGTLLALARTDDGQIEIDASPFELAQTIDQVADIFRHDEDRQGVSLVTLCDPLTLVGDEDMIIQVLVNLVDNAYAHTPGGGMITVTCERSGGWALVRVIDTGEGIAEQHLERVFDRFYRADAGRRAGAGLGLAISKAIIERHGGDIRLESVVGEGTTIELRLPLGN